MAGPVGPDPVSRGRFIVVEGAEGVGKSTQVTRLRTFLERADLSVVAGREPGRTAVGEGIRQLLLHGADGSVPAETELLLILAARAAYVRCLVAPALAAGEWVVSDRFDLSSFAYQGFGRGIDRARIDVLNRFATGGLVPDLYLVLDLPVEEGLARQARAGKAGDRFESAGIDFLRKVRQGYVGLAESMENAVLVPAGAAAEEVERRIRREVVRRFHEVRAGTA